MGDERAVMYLSHAASGRSRLVTLCGQPWQQWQAPRDMGLFVVPPAGPVPTGAKIAFCEACRQLSLVDEAPKLVPGLNIQPGDRVLLAMPDASRLDKDNVDRLHGLLEDRFPGTQFTITSAAEIAVMRPRRLRCDGCGQGPGPIWVDPPGPGDACVDQACAGHYELLDG